MFEWEVSAAILCDFVALHPRLWEPADDKSVSVEEFPHGPRFAFSHRNGFDPFVIHDEPIIGPQQNAVHQFPPIASTETLLESSYRNATAVIRKMFRKLARPSGALRGAQAGTSGGFR